MIDNFIRVWYDNIIKLKFMVVKDMKIDVNMITPKQKLTIEKGLCDYQYIMDNWQVNDSDFQNVFYDFYLKARWSVMTKPSNKKLYFQKLQSISPKNSLLDILIDLKDKMEKSSYEFSLASKLLHTRNDMSPIYDSKVRIYLSQEENVNFWWQIPLKVSGAPRGTSDIKKIEHDWSELKCWYTSFISSQKGKQWIDWFNINFPNYTYISDIKKVDFIIFATC